MSNKPLDDLDECLRKMNLQANSKRAHVFAGLFQFVGEPVSAARVAGAVGMLPPYGSRRPRRQCVEADVLEGMTIRIIENRLMGKRRPSKPQGEPCSYRLIIDEANTMLYLVLAEDEERRRSELHVPYVDYFANFKSRREED